MPTLVTRGAISARAFGALGVGYVKPALIRTGAVGTITSNAAGYLMTGFDQNTYAYLDAPKSVGKWYWEQVAANYILSGVTITPTTPRLFAGYTANNAGVYTSAGQLWNEWGVVPPQIGAISPGAIIGYALDVGGKTLAIYVNNVLGATIPLTTITTPIYPMFGVQIFPTTQINLSAAGCVYVPPLGYNFI